MRTGIILLGFLSSVVSAETSVVQTTESALVEHYVGYLDPRGQQACKLPQSSMVLMLAQNAARLQIFSSDGTMPEVSSETEYQLYVQPIMLASPIGKKTFFTLRATIMGCDIEFISADALPLLIWQTDLGNALVNVR